MIEHSQQPAETDLKRRLDRLDVAWQEPTPPEIADFLVGAGNSTRHELLIRLIRIDLEYRWRRYEADSRKADVDAAILEMAPRLDLTCPHFAVFTRQTPPPRRFRT